MEELLVDEFTYIFKVHIPAERVVYLQGLFELYEGLAVLRTIEEGTPSLVTIITTPGQKDTIRELLGSLGEKWNLT